MNSGGELKTGFGLAAVLLLLPTIGWSQSAPTRVTAPAIQQAPVDFNHPPRKYSQKVLLGWHVFIEKQLETEAPAAAAATLKRLRTTLEVIHSELPQASLTDLKRLKFYVLYGPKASAGGRASGLEYYRADAHRYWPWLDPRMDQSILIYNAENYNSLSDLWVLKAVAHELGHAQHLMHGPEDRADIYDAWKNALDLGLYRTVRAEDRSTHNPNYAAVNHLEYFAELTAMYFVGCNYYPHNRAELKAYDPDGFALVQKLWTEAPKEADPNADPDWD